MADGCKWESMETGRYTEKVKMLAPMRSKKNNLRQQVKGQDVLGKRLWKEAEVHIILTSSKH